MNQVPNVVQRPSLDLQELSQIAPKRFDAGLLESVAMARPSLPIRTAVRLSAVQILDFSEPPFDSKAEPYVVSVITDGVSDDPISVEIKGYEQIRRKQFLPLGEALGDSHPGVMLYHHKGEQAPEVIDIRLAVFDSDQQNRDLGAVLSTVKESGEFKNVMTAAKAIATAANPMSSLLVGVGELAFQIIANALKADKDDMLGYYAATWTPFDESNILGRHPKEDLLRVSRVNIAYEILQAQN